MCFDISDLYEEREDTLKLSFGVQLGNHDAMVGSMSHWKL